MYGVVIESRYATRLSQNYNNIIIMCTKINNNIGGFVLLETTVLGFIAMEILAITQNNFASMEYIYNNN